MAKNKIPVGISSCLLGEPVRFDGSHCHNHLILEKLGKYFSFYPLCPEVEIGLGVPRRPIHLQQIGEEIECVQSNHSDIGHTEALQELANWVTPLQQSLCGYIFKKDSPSCGIQRVKVYRQGIPERKGVGIFAKQIMHNYPLLPVEDEDQLNDKAIRENFIQRVRVMYRWNKMLAFGIRKKDLMAFHARHKLLIMSHGDYSQLGRLLAESEQANIESVAETYITLLMKILKSIPNRKQHVNVLQHIQGFLKKQLSPENKSELTRIIQRYKKGEVSLLAALTLFDHYFSKYPNEYISQSYYLSAHLN